MNYIPRTWNNVKLSLLSGCYIANKKLNNRLCTHGRYGGKDGSNETLKRIVTGSAFFHATRPLVTKQALRLKAFCATLITYVYGVVVLNMIVGLSVPAQLVSRINNLNRLRENLEREILSFQW